MTAGLKTPGETTSTSERRFSLEYPLRKGPGEPWQASASTEQAKKPQERGAASAAPGKAPRKVGRPPGKKSDPDYAQVTVYLRKDNHLAAKKRLLDDGKEFSELVNELVTAWLEKSGIPKV